MSAGLTRKGRMARTIREREAKWGIPVEDLERVAKLGETLEATKKITPSVPEGNVNPSSKERGR